MGTGSIITISREYGSGGKEIGKRLAEKLGIPYYDKEIIVLAAKQTGAPEKLFEENDEKGATNSLIFSMSVLRDTAAGNFPLADRLFMVQSQIIHDVADKGAGVIVGRCADYILKERENMINIFIHAPMADRVKRVVEEYGISGDKAANEVVKTDKHRAAYYDYYSFLKWGQCDHYDLCVNSSVGLDNAVSLIAQYVEMQSNK
ncbi:MAG: cytidylate kinase-like family protein [Angelakisella sp.]